MWGYNPQVSDICTGLNSITAVLNGVTSSINARNYGADPGQAAAIGLFNTSFGLGNAAIGNCIDKATGTYFGTTTNNIFSTAASLSNFGGYYNPYLSFGMMPFMPTFGFYSMPMFGGFSCWC